MGFYLIPTWLQKWEEENEGDADAMPPLQPPDGVSLHRPQEEDRGLEVPKLWMERGD